jgi:hypothetical protein
MPSWAQGDTGPPAADCRSEKSSAQASAPLLAADQPTEHAAEREDEADHTRRDDRVEQLLAAPARAELVVCHRQQRHDEEPSRPRQHAHDL